MAKPKTAGYVVLIYEPQENCNRVGVAVAHPDLPGVLALPFSGQGGTLFPTRAQAVKYAKATDRAKVGRRWASRQHFVVRVTHPPTPANAGRKR